MRKIKYFIFGAATLLLTACSEDKIYNEPTGDEAILKFNVSLPESFETRALGQGTAATQLLVLVYDSDTNQHQFTYEGEGAFGTDGNASVNLQLVAGKNYQIIFFAGAPEALSGDNPVYAINTVDGTLNVDYYAMTSEGNLADYYDCFYYSFKAQNVTSLATPQSISLTRPVAQINWGTDDLGELTDTYGPDGQDIETRLTFTPYTSLNLLTGQPTLGVEEVQLVPFAIPKGESFPAEVTGMTYIANQYILAPASATNISFTIWISNAGNEELTGPFDVVDVSVTQAPVQANFQTNIYGSLLTDPSTILISKSEWTQGYNPDLHWDGVTRTTPKIDTSARTVSIEKASDLVGLADLVNGDSSVSGVSQNLANFTVTLTDDFDMGGFEFTQIGNVNRVTTSTISGNSFRGTFDGQGHTISNLYIKGTSSAADATGFIGALDKQPIGNPGQLQNVTFRNLVIDAPNNEQAGVVGLVNGGASVSNVVVESGSITSAQGAGGIVGRLMLNGTVSECKNYASIKTGTNGGGIVGAAYYTSSTGTMTISKCENYGEVSGNGYVGGIAGLSAAVIDGCTNEGNVSSSGACTGGIVGQQWYAGSITGCTNNGYVDGGGTSSGNYGAGGIVGWVRYTGAGGSGFLGSLQEVAAYPSRNVITVNGNTNTGNVKGQTGVGGIVGVFYNFGECNQNTNTATSLIALNGFVAGIVGNSQWSESPSTTGFSGSGNKNYLFVNNNYSTTTEEQMQGNLKAEFVYINDYAKTTAEGNSQTDQDVTQNN